jgi:hypothetical protein
MNPNFTINDVLKYIYQEASSQLKVQIHLVRNRDDTFNEVLLEFESLRLKLDQLRLTPNNLSIENFLSYCRKQKFESA